MFTTVLRMVNYVCRSIFAVCMHATSPTDAGCPTHLTHICTFSTTYLPHHTCIPNHLIATRYTLKLLDAFWKLLSRHEQRERNNIVRERKLLVKGEQKVRNVRQKNNKE